MERLFDDITIKKMQFSPNGRDLELTFIDMYKGDFLAKIKCKSLYVSSYQTILEEDEFPCYIGEVNYEILRGQELSHKIQELDFAFYRPDESGFVDWDGPDRYTPEMDCHHFVIGGGEIYIEIICQEVEIDYAKQ